MRSLGIPEVLIILGLLVLLFGGARLPALLGYLGHKAGGWLRQWRWIWHSVAGSEEEEIRAEESFGRELAARFLEQMPRATDGTLSRRVAAVGARLAQAPLAAPRRFHFDVVEAGTANAYALPGGYVFVTRRLAGLCGDDGELAFLLGHEMGHILARHFAEKTLMTALLSALRGGGVVAELLGKGYSQQQEFEADEKGLELAVQAGFGGEGALALLGKLATVSPGLAEFAQYFSTHPSTAERIASVRRAWGATARRS
jgi:predicted Zn-dependent protease